MRSVIVFFAVVAAVTAHRQQNSGYENAEAVQPAPSAPLSAGNGDQQAYNSDASLAAAAPLSPAPPPPPAPVQNWPRPCPASYALPSSASYASPPQASYPAPAQNSYGTSPPPPLNPVPAPGSTYAGAASEIPPVNGGNGIGYKNRRVFQNRARNV
ncbi:unnamed protein product [Cylicocyclus nassatus]|uniref:Uncharacterized protein n=1 Tax=Cylicocyclus nassatus TaxID=53992 RepID=A0AA36M8G2_CYLNA|nr:unnamed protein product [Cylicocyclus nassatus]